MSCFLLDKGEKGKREKGLDDVVVGVIDDGGGATWLVVMAQWWCFPLEKGKKGRKGKRKRGRR